MNNNQDPPNPVDPKMAAHFQALLNRGAMTGQGNQSSPSGPHHITARVPILQEEIKAAKVQESAMKASGVFFDKYQEQLNDFMLEQIENGDTRPVFFVMSPDGTVRALEAPWVKEGLPPPEKKAAKPKPKAKVKAKPRVAAKPKAKAKVTAEAKAKAKIKAKVKAKLKPKTPVNAKKPVALKAKPKHAAPARKTTKAPKRGRPPGSKNKKGKK